MTTVTIRGCDLACERLGDAASVATPFVWGHGLSSSRASEDLEPLVDLGEVADDRPVVRYDARGHGASGDLDDPSSGDWAELARDQIELIDRLDLDRVALGGASMGAATALHAALALDDRVDRLVLVIPPTAWETRSAQVDVYEQMASILDARGVGPLVAGLEATPPPDPYVGDDTWLPRRTALLRAADPVRLAAVFRGAAHADLPAPDAIASIDVPALILVWTGDPGHPVSTAERLGALLPTSETAIASTADELATWTDRVRSFLAG